MKKMLISVIFISFICNSVCFANSNQHPIDVELEKCLQDKFSTLDMNNCVVTAQKLWLKEIKTETQKIKKQLSDEQLKIFNCAQQKWVEYYNAEQNSISETLFAKTGSINSNFGNGYLLEILKQRALFLKQYSYLLVY